MLVAPVARLIGEHDTRVWRVVQHYVTAARQQEDFSTVRQVGIDETSRKRRHPHVTICADLDRAEVLSVTEGRDMTTIGRFHADFRAHGGDDAAEIPVGSVEDSMNEWQLTTPVVLIIHRRPDTTAQVFAQIAKAKPRKLLIVADGPRPGNVDDIAKCHSVRRIVEEVSWDCEVLRDYSDTNLGCKIRVSSGLDWVFEHVEEAIILEDDCVPHSSFFRFCQELLEKYRDDERVMVISGDNFQFGRQRANYSYYFSRFPHCWGWATWKRAWELYDMEMKIWPELRDGGWLWDILGDRKAVKYWLNIFNDTYEGKVDSWAYIWALICWVQHGLSILPNVNLVANIGFGKDASHTAGDTRFTTINTEEITFPLVHPPIMVRDRQADQLSEVYIFRRRLWNRVKNKVGRLIGWGII